MHADSALAGRYPQISSAVKESTGAINRVRVSRMVYMAVWALRRAILAAGAV